MIFYVIVAIHFHQDLIILIFYIGGVHIAPIRNYVIMLTVRNVSINRLQVTNDQKIGVQLI